MTAAPNSETAAIEAAAMPPYAAAIPDALRQALGLTEQRQPPRTAMNFPGTNSLTLNEDAIVAALRSILPMLVGARITSLQMRGYPTRLEVDFTTDPEPPSPAA